jgi:hypothetical protein
MSGRKGSSSFLKKRTKKLLLLGFAPGIRTGRAKCVTNRTKVFWFFFSKKNCFFFAYFRHFLRVEALPASPPRKQPL